MQRKIICKGASIISVEMHPDHDHPVAVKKPAKRHPTRRILQSLENEFEMTRSLHGVRGVRGVLGRMAVDQQPALILEWGAPSKGHRE